VTAPLASAIYEGRIRHRRFRPTEHAFEYRMFMLYLDLDEVDRVFDGRWLWSTRGRNVAEFRRSDFLGDASVGLADAVRDRVEASIGERPTGPVRLLTHLRYFGHSFNPVSFYYCYEHDGETLAAVVAEITNTPWRERHAYVLPIRQAESHGIANEWSFDKDFHVSPFMPMRRGYRWRFTPPGAGLRVHMDVLDEAARDFDATLVLERRDITGPALARCLARYPLMTTQVVAAIHWQAFKLWLKKTPVHDHPTRRTATGTTHE
jgi:DUF1365 family protein